MNVDRNGTKNAKTQKTSKLEGLVAMAKNLGHEEARRDMVQDTVLRIDAEAETWAKLAIEWKSELRGEENEVVRKSLLARLKEENDRYNNLQALRRTYFQYLEEIRTQISMTQARLTNATRLQKVV